MWSFVFLLPIRVGQPHKLNFMLLACLMSHARGAIVRTLSIWIYFIFICNDVQFRWNYSSRIIWVVNISLFSSSQHNFLIHANHHLKKSHVKKPLAKNLKKVYAPKWLSWTWAHVRDEDFLFRWNFDLWTWKITKN